MESAMWILIRASDDFQTFVHNLLLYFDKHLTDMLTSIRDS